MNVFLRQHGIRYTIPRKVNEHRGGSFERQIYRQRNRVERLPNRLKHFRRIATRHEKRAVNYAAMLTVTAIVFWLQALQTRPGYVDATLSNTYRLIGGECASSRQSI